MNYIYKMSEEMFFETLTDANEEEMSMEKYVTTYFGLRGKCIKVEIL